MKKILSEIQKFLKERGWDKLKPSDVAKSVCIEAAELLEVFQWDSLDIQETKKDKDRMERIEKEVADVLIYALYFPILLNLDAEQLIREKLRHNSKKYPAELMRKRKNGSHTDKDIYIQIKRKYREEN